MTQVVTAALCRGQNTEGWSPSVRRRARGTASGRRSHARRNGTILTGDEAVSKDRWRRAQKVTILVTPKRRVVLAGSYSGSRRPPAPMPLSRPLWGPVRFVFTELSWSGKRGDCRDKGRGGLEGEGVRLAPQCPVDGIQRLSGTGVETEMWEPLRAPRSAGHPLGLGWRQGHPPLFVQSPQDPRSPALDARGQPWPRRQSPPSPAAPAAPCRRAEGRFSWPPRDGRHSGGATPQPQS